MHERRIDAQELTTEELVGNLQDADLDFEIGSFKIEAVTDMPVALRQSENSKLPG